MSFKQSVYGKYCIELEERCVHTWRVRVFIDGVRHITFCIDIESEGKLAHITMASGEFSKRLGLAIVQFLLDKEFTHVSYERTAGGEQTVHELAAYV